MRYAWLCLPFVLLASAVPAQTGSVAVVTEAGAVRGAAAHGVESWKGIPFAAPPVGDNRWREPQPAARWSGVRDATAFGHDCMQKPFPSDAAPLGTEPSEDCLVLNVWRPEGTTARSRLPVLVWIYGGGYVNGGASPAVYSGEKFARDGIVFVSFNYRLGRFGFFAHPALTAAREGLLGNYGFMDQIAALKWVKRNIAAFGGDPSSVTVFGESAGGGSTLMVLTSPLSRGLFRRIAVMSGGGRGSLLPARKISQDMPGRPSAEWVGIAFARSVGVEGTGADALAKLRALPAEQVVQGLNMSSMRLPETAATYVGGPLDDGVIVTGTPDAVIRAGQAASVPVMIGATSADIGFLSATTKDELFALFGDKAAAARALYDPTGTADAKTLVAAVAADRMMVEPARLVAGLASARGQPAYHYRFGYVADSLRDSWREGARHASDIPWAFDTVDAKYGDKLTARDRRVARTWHAYFSNFARKGDPNGPGLPRWQRFTAANGFTMVITPDGAAVGGADPWKARLDLIAATAFPGP